MIPFGQILKKIGQIFNPTYGHTVCTQKMFQHFRYKFTWFHLRVSSSASSVQSCRCRWWSLKQWVLTTSKRKEEKKNKKKDFYSKSTWIEFQVRQTPFRGKAATSKGGAKAKIKERNLGGSCEDDDKKYFGVALFVFSHSDPQLKHPINVKRCQTAIKMKTKKDSDWI